LRQLAPPPAAVAHDIIRLDHVWNELQAQQQANIRKASSTSFRYNSELVLDLSFEVWFRGGTKVLFTLCISTSLLTFAVLGRAVHDFLANTLFVGGFSQIPTMLKRQMDTLSPLVEPGFSMERFALAARFYEQLEYKHRFFSSCNDATAIRAAVTCRLQDNVLLGLGTMEDVRCGPTMRDIEAAALQHGIATQVDIHLLNPLDPMLPSFVLGIFPQNGRVNGEIMELRGRLSMTVLRTLECMSLRIVLMVTAPTCPRCDAASTKPVLPLHPAAQRRCRATAMTTTVTAATMTMMTPHLRLHLPHPPHHHITCSHAIEFCRLRFHP
jgi:hypothetical protein